MEASFDFWTHLPAVIPELLLTVLAVVVLLLDLYGGKENRRNIAFVSAIGLAAIAVTPLIWGPSEQQVFWGGMVRYDLIAQIFKVMIIIGASITCLMAADDSEVGHKGEFYLIVIVATLGASLIAAAADLIMVFVGLETLSIPLYILAAFRRDDERSSESGMKYFLFGAFSSGVMLYGFSLLYGFTGETNIYTLSQAFPAAVADNPLPLIGALLMLLVGFGFKVSMVPFHFWTPDVYEGAPTPVTAYVSVASKAASFALLVRVLLAVFPVTLVIGQENLQTLWVNLVSVLAIVTMTIGNVLALRQTNIKRLLAYSSIAQAGYVLVGVAAMQSQSDYSVASVAFYLLMYTFTNLGAFAGVLIFSETTGSENIKDMGGLSRRNPWLALGMTIAILSLAGIPPAAGFFGKFYLFTAAVNANMVLLAIIAVLNAIVALYYYLIVIKVMYVDRSQYDSQSIALSRSTLWVIGLTSIAVLLLGTFGAQPFFDWAAQGAQALLAL